jgi:hypothetical protein
MVTNHGKTRPLSLMVEVELLTFLNLPTTGILQSLNQHWKKESKKETTNK